MNEIIKKMKNEVISVFVKTVWYTVYRGGITTGFMFRVAFCENVKTAILEFRGYLAVQMSNPTK